MCSTGLAAPWPSHFFQRRGVLLASAASEFGSVTVCRTCRGHAAVFAALEGLAPLLAVEVKVGHCFRRCGAGPNCTVETAQRNCSDDINRMYGILQKNGSKTKMVSNVGTFERCLDLLREASASDLRDLPAVAVLRARLYSDALRHELTAWRSPQVLQAAETCLAKAIALEAGATDKTRLAHLHLIRARLLGSRAVGRFQEALHDCSTALAAVPDHKQAHLMQAKVLEQAGQYAAALAAYERMLAAISARSSASSQKDIQLRRQLMRLVDRLRKMEGVEQEEKQVTLCM